MRIAVTQMWFMWARGAPGRRDAVEDHPEELADGATGDSVEAAVATLAATFNPRGSPNSYGR